MVQEFGFMECLLMGIEKNLQKVVLALDNNELVNLEKKLIIQKQFY